MSARNAVKLHRTQLRWDLNVWFIREFRSGLWTLFACNCERTRTHGEGFNLDPTKCVRQVQSWTRRFNPNPKFCMPRMASLSQWMVMMDGICCLILPEIFRIGINGLRHFGRRSVTTLRVSSEPSSVRRFSCGDSLPHDISARAWFGVSFQPFEDLRVRQAHPTSKCPEEVREAMSAPFEDLRAVSLSNRSNRFMAKIAPEPLLMLPNNNFLDRLMSDRG